MRKEPNRNVYVGHRYVPKIMGEWNNQNDYEGLSIVTHQGTSYTSKKRVPSGIDISNEEFWVVTGNYNAQVEYYREETERVSEDLLLKPDQSYVDTELGKKTDKTYVDTELGKKTDKTYVDNKFDDVYEDFETKFIDVTKYGAVSDGTTDNSTAFTNALHDAISENKFLYIPKQENNYLIDDYIYIDGFKSMSIFSNGAEIYGKGFFFENGDHLRIEGLKFIPKIITSTVFDDGIRAYKVNKVDVKHNVFDSTGVRIRNDETPYKNDYINISENMFTGDMGLSRHLTFANLIEVRGQSKVFINKNNVDTLNAYHFIKLTSTMNDEINSVKDRGFVDIIKITDNIFKGSINGRRMIDCYAGTDNIIMSGNHIEVAGISSVIESKIAGEGSGVRVNTLRNYIITGNTVRALDSTLGTAFRIYSYKNSSIDYGESSNVIYTNNIFENTTTSNIVAADFRGWSSVICNNNSIAGKSTTGNYVVLNFTAVSDLTIQGNNIENGSIGIYKSVGTSNADVKYDGSAEHINISGNTLKDIRDIGGIIIRFNDNIKTLIINGNNMTMRKLEEDYIISSVYIRDCEIDSLNVMGNTVFTDVKDRDRLTVMNTPVKYRHEKNNSWNPQHLYGFSIPTEGTFNKGDRITYTNPSINTYVGAVCVTAGSPGTWAEYGQVAPNT